MGRSETHERRHRCRESIVNFVKFRSFIRNKINLFIYSHPFKLFLVESITHLRGCG
ncbi:hypothetical protein AtNW77_Chr5g0148001 [Arabidopsis thaliana]